MTMHTVFFKEHEGIGQNGGLSAVPRWSGLGSQPPPASYVAGEALVQSKLASLELSAGGTQFSYATKEPEEQLLQGLGKGNATCFTLFPGDCRTAENGEKSQLQNGSSVQAATIDYQGNLELGFGQPLVCGKYPYAEQCYEVYSAYGTHIMGRMMLPLSMATDGGPIYVNAKQYHRIIRRRKKRAEAELENRVIKLRKPYLHLSRHLHAMRRPRGNGGRFLNTKSSNGNIEKSSPKKAAKGKQLQQPTGSQMSSEVVQSDGSRSTSPGSEVNSDHLFSSGSINLHPFEFNHLYPSFQHFPGAGSTGIGNYLKV